MEAPLPCCLLNVGPLVSLALLSLIEAPTTMEERETPSIQTRLSPLVRFLIGEQ